MHGLRSCQGRITPTYHSRNTLQRIEGVRKHQKPTFKANLNSDRCLESYCLPPLLILPASFNSGHPWSPDRRKEYDLMEQQTTPQSPLLRLPQELRDLIYHYTVLPEQPVILLAYRTNAADRWSGPWTLVRRRPLPSSSGIQGPDIPFYVTPLALHVLGKLAGAPIVRRMLIAEPHMNRDKLSSLKYALEADWSHTGMESMRNENACVRAYFALSLINRQVHSEASAFFFSHLKVKICYPWSSLGVVATTDRPAIPNKYVGMLRSISTRADCSLNFDDEKYRTEQDLQINVSSTADGSPKASVSYSIADSIIMGMRIRPRIGVVEKCIEAVALGIVTEKPYDVDVLFKLLDLVYAGGENSETGVLQWDERQSQSSDHSASERESYSSPRSRTQGHYHRRQVVG